MGFLPVTGDPTMRFVRVLVPALLAVATACGATWITVINLVEAYGSGAPFYGQTTNMDKWESPVAFLMVIDGVALGITIVLIAVARGFYRMN